MAKVYEYIDIDLTLLSCNVFGKGKFKGIETIAITVSKRSASRLKKYPR